MENNTDRSVVKARKHLLVEWKYGVTYVAEALGC